MWWLVVTICLLLGVYLYVKLVRPHSYWKNRGVPYVKPVPAFGSMFDFWLQRKSMVDIMTEMYTAFDGKYFGQYQMVYPILVLKDLELIKQVTIKDFNHFTDHREFLPKETEPLFGKTLFSLKGERWKDMRSTLSPAYTSSKMRAMYVLINECAEQFVKHFESKTTSEREYLMTGYVTVEMKDIFTRYTNDVIATCAFGVTCDSLTNPTNEFYMTGKEAFFNFAGIKNLLIFIQRAFPKLSKMLGIRFFNKRVRRFFRGLITRSIQYREENGVIRPDMVHLLMEARKGRLKHEEFSATPDYSDGFATVEESNLGKARVTYKAELNDDDIVAQALIFFLAGFDTTSTALTFASYELAINPDIQEKLYHEINDTMEQCGGNLTYELILKMKYLDMVMSESLRKWPPAIKIDRVCVKPYILDSGGTPVNLEVDNIVWIPIYNIHHDPKYYPNPELFDPERFSDENKEKILPHSFLPFGSGPRNCIGSRLALLETKTILVRLIHKFEIAVIEKTQIPLKLSKKFFNLASEEGVWLGLKLRKTSAKD